MSGAMAQRTALVAVPADHAPNLRLRGAMLATSLAEHFRAQGRRVLLLIDSLTRIAHAAREIGLLLGEPGAARGYPPSALATITKLVERAGNSAATGGSITGIYTVLADGDDHNDPVVDTARSILDGHIVLSRELAQRAQYPAIDVAASLSRVMTDIVPPDHAGSRAGSARCRQLRKQPRPRAHGRLPAGQPTCWSTARSRCTAASRSSSARDARPGLASTSRSRI
jgi:flagellum-specific ATP synthase